MTKLVMFQGGNANRRAQGAGTTGRPDSVNREPPMSTAETLDTADSNGQHHMGNGRHLAPSGVVLGAQRNGSVPNVSSFDFGHEPVDHLDLLESHAIFILREVAAESERPVLLFSGGKDSAVLLHLAKKAFRPGGFPFPVLHVDTGHNFDEVLDFRDAQVKALDERLIVARVQDSIDNGRVADPGYGVSRNRLQTTTLLDAITEHRFDACLGGARRDEDKARAKERVLSFRDAFGQWDPKRQRPELWQLYQGRVLEGEHLRAFPLSDWTELDIWQYIGREGIDLPSIYFAHQRPVVERDGMLLALSQWIQPTGNEFIEETTVRFRTVGDATCTGAVRSEAASVEEIIDEVAASRISERGATRADDRFSETAMEDRKREGYF
jgi:sulfate adenylyltransferase subunit 2